MSYLLKRFTELTLVNLSHTRNCSHYHCHSPLSSLERDSRSSSFTRNSSFVTMQQPHQPRKRTRRPGKASADARGDGPKKARNGQPSSATMHSMPAQSHTGLSAGAVASLPVPVQNGPHQQGLVQKPSVQSETQAIRGDAQPYASLAGKLDSRLLKALEVMRFAYMTPVQQKVLASLPTYRSDCLVRAKTGTGKTVAFFLPALHSLLNSPPLPHGQVGILVISPTRELALQIAKECDQLTSQMSRPLECHTAFGGMYLAPQLNWKVDTDFAGTARASNLNKFMRGAPSILVATPGRLLDYLSEPATAAKLSNIQTLILDEADTMLESGFLQNVKDILRLLPPKQQAGWQGMCFSATIPEKIKDVINVVLRPGYTSLSTIDENAAPTIDKVPQFHIIMPSFPDMFTTLASLLDAESATNSKILVFGVTANMVALFAKLFSQGLTSLQVYELHSRLNQNIRTRTTAEFKAAAKGVLFASDVVGRGMDFPNVDLVVQVGLPTSADQYIHRVGRTGRAENSGRAVILLTQSETFFLKQNAKLPIQQHPHTAEILAGAVACTPRVQMALNTIEETTKQRAYSSFLGFFAGSGLMKPLRLDKAGLVHIANDMAVRGMGCPEPPRMEKKTIGKMGLKGVSGIKYTNPNEASQGGGGGGGSKGGWGYGRGRP